jgi:hypothetical protein
MSARARRAWACLSVTGLVLASSQAAWAFRTIENHPEVPDGVQVRWPYGVFEYRVHEDPEDSIDVEAFAEASRQALRAWSSADCGLLVPADLGTTTDHAAPGDGQNTIEFVESDWDTLGFPEEATGAADVLFEEQDDGTWAIVEADVYINAEHHRFTTADSPEGDERSLLGVLTHEIGHALGLLHPCELDGADGAPACDEDDLPDALMSPYYKADQTAPEADDYEGLCYLYPGCATDEDCGEGFVCSGKECFPVEDPGGEECDSGAGGQSGEECAPKRPIGVECTESNQCEGEQCLAGVHTFPVCTQRCGEGQADCPKSWTCTAVEDRRVCMPPDREAGCECALTPSARSSQSSKPPAGFLIAAGIGLGMLLRVRRRRARRRVERMDGTVGGEFLESRS